ncbi:hypothetical protein VPH35_034890 [Triticum aestivum]
MGAPHRFLAGALGVKGACRRGSAGWIHLDLGPSIPALPGATGGCSVTCRVADVTMDEEKSLVGLLLAETAATRPVVFHLDGVVFILGLVMFWVCFVELCAW